MAIRNDDGGEPENNNNGGNDNNGGGTSTPTNNNNNGGGSAGSGNAGGSGSGGGSTPAPSSRAALSDLVVTPRDGDGNPGKRLSLSPAFAPSTTAYTLDVPYTTGTLDIMPGLTSGTAAVGTRRDGTTRVFPAAPSYSISLPPGETTVVAITVTAEDGSRTRAYTLRVTRAAPNTDPSLPALVVRGNDDADITLSPGVHPGQYRLPGQPGLHGGCGHPHPRRPPHRRPRAPRRARGSRRPGQRPRAPGRGQQ